MLVVILISIFIAQSIACDEKIQLIRAVRANDVEKVQKLLDRGFDVNSSIDDGELTPLMIAAVEERSAIAQLMIDRGANVSATNKYGRTPLHFAARGGDCTTIQVLVSAGAKVNPPKEPYHTVLMEAADAGKSNAVKCLLVYGARVDAVDDGESTALIHAVWSFDVETVRSLVVAGADLTKKNKQGQTAHDIASRLENGNRMAIILRVESP